jgi:hypothetical protein
MTRFKLIFPIICSLLVLASTDTMAATPMEQAKKEIDTAIYHGKASSDASSVDNVKAHLKHVINCIEGPEGKDFDSSAMNPCDGQGNGIIPDLKAAGPEGSKALKHVQEADKIAVSSSAESDLHTLHSSIDELVSHLEEAKSALGN